MAVERDSDRVENGASSLEDSVHPRKEAYEPPRIEKRRSVARVTLLSAMGQMGVGVIGMMP
jgi:hypothetical protein